METPSNDSWQWNKVAGTGLIICGVGLLPYHILKHDITSGLLLPFLIAGTLLLVFLGKVARNPHLTLESKGGSRVPIQGKLGRNLISIIALILGMLVLVFLG